jgi:hypothetical protein
LEVVGLERGPLNLVRINETEINGRETHLADHETNIYRKSWH